MKKSLWLVLVLILACVLTLSACDKDTDQPQNPNTEQSTNQPSDNNDETTDTDNTQTPSTNNTECQHTFGEWITITEATCKENGEAKRICSQCSVEEKKSIDKTNNHTEVIDAATESTCKVNGKTEGKHCSVCELVIIEQTPLPLANHTYDNEEDEKCNVCDFARDVNCKHTETITLQAVAPTCIANGLTEGKKCTKCEETLVAQTTVGSLGHDFTNYVSDNNATYESDGTKTAKCNNVGCNAKDTIKDIGSMLIKSEISFATLTVNGTTVQGVVSNATEVFSFGNEISTTGNADYIVALDEFGIQTSLAKNVPLTVGDNTFYVFQTVDGKTQNTYVVTIRRLLYRKLLDISVCGEL